MTFTRAPISEESIEKAWKEVHSLVSAGHLDLLMDQFAEDQSEIVDFLAEAAEQWGSDAADAAYHGALVIWRSFAKDRDAPPVPVSTELLVLHGERNLTWIDSQQGDSILLQKKMTDARLFREPNLMRYVIEAVFEAHEDGLELEPAEQEQVFLTLKTIVDSF